VPEIQKRPKTEKWYFLELVFILKENSEVRAKKTKKKKEQLDVINILSFT